MTHDMLAISKLFLSNLRYNKLALAFNLLFPTIFFFYTNQIGNINAHNIFNNISFFWAYIIFVSILNFMVLPVINYRESGIYKQLWLTINKKHSIIPTIFLVYTIVIALELIIFNLTIMLANQMWQPALLIGSLLTLLVFGSFVYMELNLLLILKIKPETITILTTILIFSLFSLTVINPDNFYLQIICMLNPVKFLLISSTWMIGIITGQGITSLITLQIFVVAIVMVIIGVLSLKNFNVNPLIRQS